MAHGEGLSGKHAVGNDAAEQLALLHRGQQEADRIFLLGKANQRVVVMDVVDLARVVLEVLIQEVLEDADGQLALVLIENDRFRTRRLRTTSRGSLRCLRMPLPEPQAASWARS